MIPPTTRRAAALPRATRLAVALAFGLALAACDDDEPTRPASAAELDRVHAATEKYQDVNRAVADGYVDAHIVTQGMGRHYLNNSLVDGRFDAEHPEILVYAPQPGGRLQLVAVEYGVPLDQSATAPEGFTGAADVWDRTTKYGLWTLHAWIWRDNAAGVFAPMNSAVQLDPTTIEGVRDAH
jgi:hypothetical protein